MVSYTRVLLGCCFVGLLAGCGGGTDKTVPVSGRLLENGQPYKYAAKEGLPPGVAGIRIEFVSMSGTTSGQASHPTVFNTGDSTFTIQQAAKLKGIPAGKYRIVVEMGSGGTPTGSGPNPFGRDNSPLTVEIPEGKGNVKLAVDLGKKTVTVE